MYVCKHFILNYTNMSNFHALEVVGRSSETQLRVVENVNKITLREHEVASISSRE